MDVSMLVLTFLPHFQEDRYVHIVAVQSITYILIPTNIHDMQIFSPKITCCNHFLGSSTEVLIPLSISGELYIRTNCIIFYGRNKKVSNKKLLESKLICNEIKNAKYYYLCFLHHRHSYFVILDNGNSMLLWKKYPHCQYIHLYQNCLLSDKSVKKGKVVK